MRIKYEVSAGGLVLRWNGGSLEALLIGRGESRVWSLPKGHVEARETHEQAALREVREETGCWAESEMPRLPLSVAPSQEKNCWKAGCPMP